MHHIRRLQYLVHPFGTKSALDQVSHCNSTDKGRKTGILALLFDDIVCKDLCRVGKGGLHFGQRSEGTGEEEEEEEYSYHDDDDDERCQTGGKGKEGETGEMMKMRWKREKRKEKPKKKKYIYIYVYINV